MYIHGCIVLFMPCLQMSSTACMSHFRAVCGINSTCHYLHQQHVPLFTSATRPIVYISSTCHCVHQQHVPLFTSTARAIVYISSTCRHPPCAANSLRRTWGSAPCGSRTCGNHWHISAATAHTGAARERGSKQRDPGHSGLSSALICAG
jgi:hypothetical protein